MTHADERGGRIDHHLKVPLKGRSPTTKGLMMMRRKLRALGSPIRNGGIAIKQD